MSAFKSVKTLSSSARRIAVTALPLLLASAGINAQEFSYNGDSGPDHWEELNDEWAACAGEGTEGASPAQSPINIRTGRVVADETLGELELVTFPTTIDMFNNGHTIEQTYEDTGTSIVFDGITYELSQFHFHTLSEHTIKNRNKKMEMHGVFTEPGGTDLVLAQLWRISGSDPDNAFVQTLIDAGLPAKDGDTTETDTMVDVGDAFTNLDSYYTYSGSLTTPPCSEVVTWVVLKDLVSVSKEQHEAFRKILGNNFRPVQDTAGREVRGTVD